MLVYRGELALGAPESADLISDRLNYPLPYGYACVGQVVELGALVDGSWRDRYAFAFQPHASHFIVPVEQLLAVPAGLATDDALFLPNMETAVNLIQDAAPIIGERVMVFGQGIVGLLTTALLQEFPLATLAAADRFELRRSAALQLGLDRVLDPGAEGFREAARSAAGERADGYDLTIEVSGAPEALNDAIAVTAFSGRIVVASWYGLKRAALDLGTRFHRSRIRIMSSQVSTIAPELGGRWNKERRFVVAWEALKRLRPAKWITQRYRLGDAAEAYSMLDASPSGSLQVAFEYR